MAKFFLMSVIFTAVLVPMRVARAKNPRRALLRTLGFCTLFNVFWGFTVVSLSEVYASW